MNDDIQQALLDADVSVVCKRWLQDDDPRTAEQKVAAVRRLHQQYRPAFGDRDVCAHCTRGMDLVYWPCPTIQAIDNLT